MLQRMDKRTRRTRLAVAMCYFAQGFCFAALLTQTNVLKDRFGFTDGELSLVLLVVPVVAGLGSVLSGLAAGRFGSAPVLRAGGLLVALSVAATGASASRPQLFAALFGVGLGLGVVDAAMNMQGVAVERRYGRPVLSSLHGVWSVGAMSGALATAGTAAAGLTTARALGVSAAVGALISLAAGPTLVRKTEIADAVRPATPDAAVNLPTKPIVLIGVAMMAMFIADSATSNWSTVFLDDVLHATPSVAALGLFAYQLCMVGGRSFGDRLVRRHGMAPVLRVGAVIGGAGLLVAAAAPAPSVAIAGFALQGLGLCVVVPLSFSAAGRLDAGSGSPGSGAAIARVNLFNYAGFVIGAGLIGAVAELADLRLAFVVPAALTVVIVAFARAFEGPEPAGALDRPVPSSVNP